MRHNQKGFTLLEMLVAIVILAGVLAVIMPGIGSVIQNRERSQIQEQALLLAQSKLAQLSAVALGPNRWQSVEDGYAVTVTVEHVDQAAGVDAYRATVSVGGQGATPVVLSTIVLQQPGGQR